MFQGQGRIRIYVKILRMKICLLYLTCANEEEAAKISQALLEKKLAFCIKKAPVSSAFLWKGKINSSSEILLIMDSLEENFEKVRKEVAKLHSYETFVLVSTPVTQTTEGVKEWVRQELKK